MNRGEKRGTKEVLKHLSRIDILRALPPQEILDLIPFVRRIRFPSGTELMKEGDPGDALYLIEKGSTRVTQEMKIIQHVGAGSVVGEAALLTKAPRNATVTAESDLIVWKIAAADFDTIVASSPELRKSLELLIESRRTGAIVKLPHPEIWFSTALRSMEAQFRGVTAWQVFFGIGLVAWIALKFLPGGDHEFAMAIVNLVAGLLIIQGACEALLHACDRLGARLRWDGFLSGTIGSLLSTAPEFVVIAFLVMVDPLAAVVTAVVTIFNNSLAFSIYSFFLPKDRRGWYSMPQSLVSAGGEILIPGATIALIVGLVMSSFQMNGMRQSLAGLDLLAIGGVLLVIYGYYIATLVKYYAEGKDDENAHPPEPSELGHNTSISGIASMFALGIIGAYTGGEAIGTFAESALGELGLPTIPTAAALAFFAGMSEYIIVYKSHRRGELGIALSNVFGGMTQVMFLLFPFALVTIGLCGFWTGDLRYVFPINETTTLLILLLFPLFYALYQHIQQDKCLSNLDAASMTGIYVLLLYFLFTAPSA